MSDPADWMNDAEKETLAAALGAVVYGHVAKDETPNTWATSVALAETALAAIEDIKRSRKHGKGRSNIAEGQGGSPEMDAEA